ncbi:hypothetical protein LTR37_008488 [Vermiconidia calcicola]|uniref:Uncharacterized protein n=1 Tax=Vermiconidia calcicola TaxID=1690605 RepID=A0ACC3NAM9_9PEZI|nr:hypothetical protein LTR37_008488 [Vermiconidia calcicola]
MADQSMYDKLAATAKAHLHACRPVTPGSSDPDPEAIKAHLSPSFHIDFGHKFFVSSTPPLQGEKTADGFIAHMTGMAAKLQTYTLDILDVCVDVEKRTVTQRVEFHMVPKGGEEVLNDIIFWMVMDESGEKVVRITEFVDAAAAAELAKRMQAGSAS